MCVYKFDYWLDDEDWYEHGYDENRLQDDAYQHLFIGWKIAALTAFGVSLVSSLSSLIIGTCAFCHRILVCVSAVLSSIAALTCLGGTAVYYMFANYQDNNIIKEEEHIYEQHFGWSFYTALIANAFMITGAVIGCVSTSVALSFGKAKLVKIEVNESDSDQLLLSGSDQPFKRSFSAIYKIDSVALRKWEREQMKSLRQNNFKRANSVPNFRRGQAISSPVFMHSNSDISKAVTEPLPQSILSKKKPMLPHTNFHRMRSFSSSLPPQPPEDRDQFPAADGPIYEYVDHNSISLNSTIKLDTLDRKAVDWSEPKTSLNVYDKVHDSRSPSIVDDVLPVTVDENEYLKPKRTNASSLIPSYSRPRPPVKRKVELLERELYERRLQEKQTTNFGTQQPTDKPTRFFEETKDGENQPPNAQLKPPKITFFAPNDLNQTSQRSSPLAPSSNTDEICINTFQANGLNRPQEAPKGSISNLSNVHASLPLTDVFERPDHSEVMSSSNGSFATPPRKAHGLKETNFDVISLASSTRYAPSEMDRSVGSTTTFLPASPSRRIYDLDDDTLNTSYASRSRPMTANKETNGETFV
uniref:Uncharacterized protein n=2 Tax=Acrobeloides nanus TaxID=290746 RepID=A0A914DW33_9BILA